MDGLRLHGQLQPSLHRDFAARFLVPLAYISLFVVPRLLVHPPGRRALALRREHVDHDDGIRALAWGGLEFREYRDTATDELLAYVHLPRLMRWVKPAAAADLLVRALDHDKSRIEEQFYDDGWIASHPIFEHISPALTREIEESGILRIDQSLRGALIAQVRVD